jgi:hypothetical protein
MKSEWVIGQFTGEQANSVDAHANAGMGYFIIDTAGRGVNRTVVAAFRRVCDSPTPAHLQKVTDPFKIQTWEKRRMERSGAHVRNDNRASDETVKTVLDRFETRKDLD